MTHSGEGRDRIKLLEEASAARGTELPEALRRPELRAGLWVYSHAFRELSTCRQIGFGHGPIPWLAIRAWCVDWGFDGDEYEYFVAMIRAMDNAFLEYVNKKKES